MSLPAKLKDGVEALSGYSMDDVEVHYASDKPAVLQAHAYTQGTDIYVAAGQERYLPHEAWHVIQQKQGRVRSGRQLKGAKFLNDDQRLEREADVMGAKAMKVDPSNVVDRLSRQAAVRVDAPGSRVVEVSHSFGNEGLSQVRSSRRRYSSVFPGGGDCVNSNIIQRVKIFGEDDGEFLDVDENLINKYIHERMVGLAGEWDKFDDPVVVTHNIIAGYNSSKNLQSGILEAGLAADTPENRFHAVRMIKGYPLGNFKLKGSGGEDFGDAMLNTMVQGTTVRKSHDYFINDHSDEGASYPALGKSFRGIMNMTGKSRQDVARAHLDLLMGRGVGGGFSDDQVGRMKEHVNVMALAEPRRDLGMHLISYMALHNMANKVDSEFDPENVFGELRESSGLDKTSDSSKAVGAAKAKKIEVKGNFPAAFKGSKAQLELLEEAAMNGGWDFEDRSAENFSHMMMGMRMHISKYFEGKRLDADLEDEDDVAKSLVDHLLQEVYGGTAVLSPASGRNHHISETAANEAAHILEVSGKSEQKKARDHVSGILGREIMRQNTDQLDKTVEGIPVDILEKMIALKKIQISGSKADSKETGSKLKGKMAAKGISMARSVGGKGGGLEPSGKESGKRRKIA